MQNVLVVVAGPMARVNYGLVIRPKLPISCQTGNETELKLTVSNTGLVLLYKFKLN